MKRYIGETSLRTLFYSLPIETTGNNLLSSNNKNQLELDSINPLGLHYVTYSINEK